MKPEEKLWIHILIRGLCDSVGLTHPNFDFDDKKIIKEAKEWIGSEYFKIICEYVKLNPNYILKLHEKIKNKKKSSTERIYYGLYARIRRLKSNNDYIPS